MSPDRIELGELATEYQYVIAARHGNGKYRLVLVLNIDDTGKAELYFSLRHKMGSMTFKQCELAAAVAEYNRAVSE